jgi:hypothetical protein
MALFGDRLLDAIRTRIAVEEQQPNPPATPEQLDRAEARLGFALPSLLRRLLTEIGNGGFGPNEGLLNFGETRPAGGGFMLGAEGEYLEFRAQPPDQDGWSWPEGWLPICHDGCGIIYVVCWREHGYPVVRMDPNGSAQDGGPGPSWFREGLLYDWLLRWAERR